MVGGCRVWTPPRSRAEVPIEPSGIGSRRCPRRGFRLSLLVHLRSLIRPTTSGCRPPLLCCIRPPLSPSCRCRTTAPTDGAALPHDPHFRRLLDASRRVVRHRCCHRGRTRCHRRPRSSGASAAASSDRTSVTIPRARRIPASFSTSRRGSGAGRPILPRHTRLSILPPRWHHRRRHRGPD